MRNLVLALFVGVLFCSLAYAAPVGNPAEPAYLKGNNRGKLSTIVNVLLGRDLDKGGAKINKGTEYTAKLAYNFMEKIEVYGLAGAATNLEISDDTTFISGSKTETDILPGLLVGGGATYVIYETDFQYKPLRFGTDVKIQYYNADFDDIRVNDANTPSLDDSYKSIEWQIALGASYQYERFIPYAGVKYSDIEIKKDASIGGVGRGNKFGADNNFGLFLGSDFIFNDYIKLNAEVRFIDETAINFGATLMY